MMARQGRPGVGAVGDGEIVVVAAASGMEGWLVPSSVVFHVASLVMCSVVTSIERKTPASKQTGEMKPPSVAWREFLGFHVPMMPAGWHVGILLVGFYSSLRRPSCRVDNDLRHCVLRRLTPPFSFYYYLALRAPDRRVPAWKVRAARSVSIILI